MKKDPGHYQENLMEQNKTADCLYQDDIKNWSQWKVVSVLTI